MFACMAALGPGWVLYSPSRVPAGMIGYANRYGTKVWTGPESFNLSTAVLRWGLPTDPYEEEGLASGITWALHPEFCSGLLGSGNFPEETVSSNVMGGFSFLTCSDLRDAGALVMARFTPILTMTKCSSSLAQRRASCPFSDS